MSGKTTIVLPVSRRENINAIFAKLELLTCDRERTNLLCVVDGDAQLFVDVRNKVEMSKFAERLCINFSTKKKLKHYSRLERRVRISQIHNLIKENINDCDFIFGLEDDTFIQPSTLEKLRKSYHMLPFAGFIQGVQVGRWGINHIGAWKLDDIYEPLKIESVMPPALYDGKILLKDSVRPIDAGGFFCFLTKKENYMKFNFEPFGHDCLGPDVNFGVQLRKIGLENYIDWNVLTIHSTPKGPISLQNSELRQVTFVKKENRWRQSRI